MPTGQYPHNSHAHPKWSEATKEKWQQRRLEKERQRAEANTRIQESKVSVDGIPSEEHVMRSVLRTDLMQSTHESLITAIKKLLSTVENTRSTSQWQDGLCACQRYVDSYKSHMTTEDEEESILEQEIAQELQEEEKQPLEIEE